MCENCGYDNTIVEDKYTMHGPITRHNCVRCGHKLNPPVTVGTTRENEGDTPRERRTLVD